MQSVSTRRFNPVPLVAALAIALSVGVGIGYVAFDGANTVPSQSRTVTREPDIHAIIVRDTGGPWVSPRDRDNVRPFVTGTRADGQGEGRIEMSTVGGTLPAETGNRPALPLSKFDD